MSDGETKKRAFKFKRMGGPLSLAKHSHVPSTNVVTNGNQSNVGGFTKPTINFEEENDDGWMTARPSVPNTALQKKKFFEPPPTVSHTGNEFGSSSLKIKKPQQMSITSFAQKKSKPVAAVAPHRSPIKADSNVSGQRKAESKLPSMVASVFPESHITIDDDDFDDFDFASSPAMKRKQPKSLISECKEMKVPSTAQETGKNHTTKTTITNISQDVDRTGLRDLFNGSDTDDELIPQPKRRRTSQIISDDEDEQEDVNYRQGNEARDRTKLKYCRSALPDNLHNGLTTSEEKAGMDNKNESKILASKPASTCTEDTLILQKELFSTLDEICDIIGKVGVSDLMSLVKNNYQRLQHLLLARISLKQKIKDIESKSLSKSSPANNPCMKSQTVRSRQFNNGDAARSTKSTHSGDSPFAARKLSYLSSTSTPLPGSNSLSGTESPNSDKNKFMFKKPSSQGNHSVSRNAGFSSPIPCGDSFFEDDAKLTQSHTSFMSSFGRKSTDPNFSCTSGYKALSADSSDFSHTPSVHQSNTSLALLQPVFNMDKLLSTSGTSNRTYDTTNNQSALDPQEPSNFSFDYKINNNSGVIATQKSFNQQSSKQIELYDDVDFIEQCQDDFFSDDFRDENDHNEPELAAMQDNLPSLSITPRRQSYNSSAVRTPNSASKHEDENKEYDGYNFPHSKEMVKIFHKVFGLREFRTNQLKAINAALLENDCFILMPTGGGKSLCYQLPALVTGGVSVIVSPLRALIQDQVTRLNSMNVPAAQLSSDIDQNQAEFVYRKMYYKTPEITLLYVTPEKISASPKLLNCLDNLYKRKLLARFVIDEAHCVSQWGHDFRPDYKKLYVLKEKYPGVPMMALTATANMRVRKDIIHQLGMKDPKRFVQSFNRPNLKFRVENKKPSTLTADITKFIKEQFNAKCGIVYCLSRNECDTVARDLSKSGIQAVSYHAGLNDGERVAIQEKWLNGNKCKVICATIAFGMGIDKPDVRFVIHYSLPKSMEGYYQEAGRAGRDGMLAHCILYYTYQDVKRLRRIIEMDQNANFESRRVHIDNLFRMVQYCENVADCRRAQLLNYFGERDFDRETCDKFRGSICDNCVSKESFQLRDVTDDVKEIIHCVKEITINGRRNNNFTLLHFVEIFRGAKTGKICDLGHDKVRLYGHGKSYSRQDGERLFRKLVIDRILIEDLQITAAEHTACYIKLGPKANDVMTGKLKVELQVQGSRKRTEVAKIGKEPVSKKEALIEECYTELVEMAKVIAAERNVRNFATVFPAATLRELARMMPESEEEMIQQKIEGLTEFRVKTYNASKFIQITSKYRTKVEDLEDTSQTEEEEDLPEWESHYFNEESTGTGNRKRGSWRRGIRRKRQGGSRSTKKEGAAKKPNLGQFSFKSRGSSKSTRGGKSKAQPSNSSSAKAGNNLGFMPVPQPRSFLSNVGSGAYF